MKRHRNDEIRLRPSADYAILKQASKRLVKACGGLESTALITRVGHSELARYYDPSEKLFMPIDIVADLETDCKNPLITRALAQLMGYELVTPPAEVSDTEMLHHWPVLLANLGQETAATLAQISAALSINGTLTADTIKSHTLTAHLNGLIQAALQLKAIINHRQQRSAQFRNSRMALTPIK